MQVKVPRVYPVVSLQHAFHFFSFLLLAGWNVGHVSNILGIGQQGEGAWDPRELSCHPGLGPPPKLFPERRITFYVKSLIWGCLHDRNLFISQITQAWLWYQGQGAGGQSAAVRWKGNFGFHHVSLGRHGSWPHYRVFFAFLFFFFDCAGSLLPQGLFPSCGEHRLLCSCGVWASHRGGFFCCRAWALEHLGFSSWGLWALEHRLRGCGALA